jgi:polar amino acid transport system substrate-binding protein
MASRTHKAGKAVRTIVALLCLLLGVQSARGADFTVGVEAINFYPIYDGTAAHYRGYGRDVLDHFASKYGYNFHYVHLPVKRLYRNFLSTNELDFKFPDNPLWQRDMRKDKAVTYSNTVYQAIEGLFVLPANRDKSLAELAAIATVRGFDAWPYKVDIANGVIELQFANTQDSLVALARQGRVGGIFYEASALNWYQHTNDTPAGDRLVLNERLPHYRPQFFLSTRKQPQIIAQFNQFLQDEADLLQRLKAKYRLSDVQAP